jgi:hypothetical protein
MHAVSLHKLGIIKIMSKIRKKALSACSTCACLQKYAIYLAGYRQLASCSRAAPIKTSFHLRLEWPGPCKQAPTVAVSPGTIKMKTGQSQRFADTKSEKWAAQPLQNGIS